MKRLFFVLIIILPLSSFGQVVFEYQEDIPLKIEGQLLKAPWDGGLNAGQYGKVDLDGDGVEEVVIYDRSGDVYLIYKRDGNDLVLQPDLNYLLPEVDPGWILFVDYNKDGKKDVFSNGSNGIVVYKNITEEGNSVQWKLVADPLTTMGYEGKFNLIANAADVPGISDIDSDGDIDIIVYNFAVGGYIRYNKNLSMELFGNADSLEYEIKTRSWGEFEECDCNFFTFNGVTCADATGGRVMHPGGKALLAIDVDGDDDMDLLAGHEQCEELYLFENKGTADSAFMTDYSNTFPNDVTPANFHIFPAGFYEDLDFDGIKDLIVTPNVEENLEYKVNFGNSNWFYKNSGTDGHPDFSLQKKRFLQENMIDLGENTVPLLLDYDSDGDYDLLVSFNGYQIGEEFSGSINYYKNEGTSSAPSFELVEENFLDVSNFNLKNPKISLSDYDGDGKEDLIYTGYDNGTNTVLTRIFQNKSSVNEGYLFEKEDNEEIDLPITMSDTPLFYDVDEDTYKDLLVAKKDGALMYYKNDGNDQFELENGSFLGISRDFTLEKINLTAAICDLDHNGDDDLVTADYRGVIQVYFDFISEMNFEPMPIEFAFENQSSGQQELIRVDQFAWISAADIFGTGNESIVVGGARGGLQILKNTGIGNGGSIGGKEIAVALYPNPMTNTHILNFKANQNVEIDILTSIGQLIHKPIQLKRFVQYELDLGNLPNGAYMVRCRNASGDQIAKKVIVVR